MTIEVGLRYQFRFAQKISASMLLLILFLSASACARDFRVADNQVEDYPTVKALQYMGKLIAERTSGRHSLTIFHSALLGEESTTVQLTRSGSLDLNRVNAAPLSRLVPALEVFNLPFLFKSREHLHSVLDGPIGQTLLNAFEESQMVGLAFFDSGARSIYNSIRPVQTLADMRGMRIRVQPSPMNENFVKALGAVPVVMEYAIVTTALQTKLVDGAENNWPSYVTRGHFMAAPYLTSTQHTMTPDVLFMSKLSWNTLSQEDQLIFRQAARDATAYMREQWQASEDAARDKASSQGVKVTETFERSAFEAAVESLVVEATQSFRLQHLVEQVRQSQPK